MLRAQIDAEREQYQPTPLEKVMAMMKSLFMRGMVIYFVVSLFKLLSASDIYIYRVLQTILMKLILLCVWPFWAALKLL